MENFDTSSPDAGTASDPLAGGVDDMGTGPAEIKPLLTLSGKQAADLLAQGNFNLGDTISMTVTAKVSGLNSDSGMGPEGGGSSVSLEVQNFDNVTGAGDLAGTGSPDPSPQHEANETPEEEAEEHATGKEAQDEDSGDGTMTDAGEEKVLGYKRPKKKKGFDVDTSAKSFSD